jgi:CHAT domain-containing protein/tetratricopeptide (TPR) repeat protein
MLSTPLLTLALSGMPVAAPALAAGATIDVELSPGEAQSFAIAAQGSQYLRIDIDPRGRRVLARLSRDDGASVAEASNATRELGQMGLSVLSESAGSYRLDVQLPDSESKARVVVALTTRPRDTQDDKRVALDRALADGRRLRGEGGAESLRDALARYAVAAALAHGLANRAVEAEALDAAGMAHFTLGELKPALDSFHDALQLRHQLGDRPGEGASLCHLAMDEKALGDTDRALADAQQALALVRAGGPSPWEREALSTLGSVYYATGQVPQALDSYKQAFAFDEQVDDRYREAVDLLNLGTMFTATGDPRGALACHQKAADIAKAQRDHRLEAAALGAVASDQRWADDLGAALENYTRSLALIRGSGDRRLESFTLHNLANLLVELGDSDSALPYFNEALTLTQATGDRPYEAMVLNSLAHVRAGAGDPGGALELYERALRSTPSARMKTSLLTGLGEAHAALGRSLEAVQDYTQALSAERAGEEQYEDETLTDLGTAYLASGNLPKAHDTLNEAIRLARARGHPATESDALYQMALVEARGGRLAEATAAVGSALTRAESARRTVGGGALQASFSVTLRKEYELAVDLAMQRERQEPGSGSDARALELCERGRARALLDSLSESRADVHEGVDRELLERRTEAVVQLRGQETHRLEILGRDHTAEQAASAEAEVAARVSQLEQIEALIHVQSPRYAALTQPQPLTVPEIQSQVLDANTLLLEYTLGEERSFLWLVSPDSLRSFELPGRPVVEAEARRVYETWSSDPEAGSTPARALGAMLLGPVAGVLGGKRLVVVADGALQYIPFAALPAPAAKGPASPLIAAHEVVTLPSASTLAVLRREVAARASASVSGVAIFADPVFANDDPRIRRRDESTKLAAQAARLPPLVRSAREFGILRFDRLPSTRREAEEIARLAPPGSTLLALDFQASRATAIGPELARRRIVHFASHGLLNSRHPDLSGIVLSLVNERGEAQDGFLQLNDIYNLKLGADLVVLSGCQTALGKDIRGEGLIGLTRGFMYAGAPRVVASLWRVSDRATAELMKRFYASILRDHMRPAAALRAAQEAIRREPRWSSPYYWAGFTLQGDWN